MISPLLNIWMSTEMTIGSKCVNVLFWIYWFSRNVGLCKKACNILTFYCIVLFFFFCCVISHEHFFLDDLCPSAVPFSASADFCLVSYYLQGSICSLYFRWAFKQQKHCCMTWECFRLWIKKSWCNVCL